MTREITLLSAANALQSFLWNNAGESAEWPLDLVCRDEETAEELRDLLQAHRNAIKEYLK